MSLTDFGAMRSVIRSLIEKNDNNSLSKVEIDYQFSFILEKITNYFAEEKYFFLFDWITETVKKEKELAQTLKKCSNLDCTEKKDMLTILIFKLHVVHVKIIELVIDEIHLDYMDFKELHAINEIELAIDSKIRAISVANSFLLYLSENRILNEDLFDLYIKFISQALDIFE